jgi:hypothetical protein
MKSSRQAPQLQDPNRQQGLSRQVYRSAPQLAAESAIPLWDGFALAMMQLVYFYKKQQRQGP